MTAEPGAALHPLVRVVTILLGLASLLLAWPVFFLLAIFTGHGGDPGTLVTVTLFGAPIFLVLLGIAGLMCVNRRRLRIVAALAVALFADLAVFARAAFTPSHSHDGPPPRLVGTVIGGRLAFVSPDDERGCIRTVFVTSPARRPPPPSRGDDELLVTEGRMVWLIQSALPGGPNACRMGYPILYGAAAPGMTQKVSPKPLLAGVPYLVSVDSDDGPGRTGCFRITPQRRVENFAPGWTCRFIPEPTASPAE